MAGSSPRNAPTPPAASAALPAVARDDAFTFTGWGLIKQELGGATPDICQQLGQFIPFANTKGERLAVSDPRLSIEERYATQGEYVRAVKEAGSALVRQRFLLIEDYDRMVETALQKGTDLWKTRR
jgi:hypothetical protein